MDSWVHVTGPSDHVTLLTLVQSDVKNKDKFRFHEPRAPLEYLRANRAIEDPPESSSPDEEESPHPERVQYKREGFNLLEVLLYDINEFYVQFKSRYKAGCFDIYKETGFKLLFYLVQQSRAPQKVHGGRLNCSIPAFVEYKHMFPCNMIQDCVGGEDETECPYTSSLCAKGQLHRVFGCGCGDIRGGGGAGDGGYSGVGGDSGSDY